MEHYTVSRWNPHYHQIKEDLEYKSWLKRNKKGDSLGNLDLFKSTKKASLQTEENV